MEGMLLRDQKTDISIGVVPPFMKRRKKPMLGVKQGNRLRYVATFRSEEDAEWFLDKFEQYLHIKEYVKPGKGKWKPQKKDKGIGDGLPDSAESAEDLAEETDSADAEDLEEGLEDMEEMEEPEDDTLKESEQPE